MKKLVCFLVLLLLVCSSAFAENATSEGLSEFTFRNGIKWGMAPFEVMAREGIESEDAFSLNERFFCRCI